MPARSMQVDLVTSETGEPLLAVAGPLPAPPAAVRWHEDARTLVLEFADGEDLALNREVAADQVPQLGGHATILFALLGADGVQAAWRLPLRRLG